MTSFFECVEMSRPSAAVAKKTAGSNNALLVVVRLVFGLLGFVPGARDIAACLSFRRGLNCLSAADAGIESLQVIS